MAKKIAEPKIGDNIYVGSSLYLSHGRDDFSGGLATIKSIRKSDHLPEDHFNYLFIEIEERPGWGYNYRSLMGEQEKLKKEYAGKIAHVDPDYAEETNRDD
jgi:hypothetical protein